MEIINIYKDIYIKAITTYRKKTIRHHLKLPYRNWINGNHLNPKTLKQNSRMRFTYLPSDFVLKPWVNTDFMKY